MRVNTYATEGDISMTRGQKICAFIEHYCLIPEGAQHWRFCLAVFFRRVFKGIEMNDPSPFQDQKMRLFDCPPYLFLKGDPRYPAIPSLQFGLPK